jgi:hypothetical protein
MKLIAILLTGIINYSGYSQADEVYEGALVLDTGETLTGNIRMPSFDLVFIENENVRLALTPQKVQVVRFHDPKHNLNRKMITRVDVEQDFQGKSFYEIVVSGEIRVLRKPRAGLRFTDPMRHLDYTYFTEWGSRLEPMRKFYSSVYRQMQAEIGPQLKEFARQNPVDPNKEADAIRIIQFYNKIKSEQLIIASVHH